MPTHWWQDRDTVFAVATDAVDDSVFTTAAELLYFFEKPWKYNDLYVQYNTTNQGETNAVSS